MTRKMGFLDSFLRGVAAAFQGAPGLLWGTTRILRSARTPAGNPAPVLNLGLARGENGLDVQMKG